MTRTYPNVVCGAEQNTEYKPEIIWILSEGQQGPAIA